MAKVNVSLPDDLLEDVDALAAELHRSRSGLVQEATARYVAEAHAERAKLERTERIEAAISGMREIAKQAPPGPDTTGLIRRDRDRDDRGRE
jgi:metal-responsive CopG/Arc/MetJ family transcriptional regulator